jgi:ribosomal 50S subunit-associated protein YjgA (DUF615 family)
VKNSYKVVGFALFTAFSAVSAMEKWTSQDRKTIRLLVQDAKSSLVNDYPNADQEHIKSLEKFCIDNGFQTYANQISKARRQGKESARRDRQNVLFGQPQAARSLDF